MFTKYVVAATVTAGILLWQLYCYANEAHTLEGSVVEAGTGKAVSHLTVSLSGDRAATTTTTDQFGHFEFTGLDAGLYRLTTKRGDGYLSGVARVTIEADPSAKKRDVVTIAVEISPSITGDVTNRDGKPVSKAMASVRAEGYRNGRRVLLSFHSTQTDVKGHFNISNLLPGEYHLQIELPEADRLRPVPATQDVSPDATIRDIRTFYPNSPEIGQSVPISLRAGQTLDSYRVVLLRSETYCVLSGIHSDETLGLENEVNIQVSELSPVSQSRVGSGKITPGQPFQLCGLPQGRYRLWSVASANGRAVYASEKFTITKEGLKLPDLLFSSALPLQGTISVAGSAHNAIPPSVQITLEAKDRIGMPGESLRGDKPRGGSFSVPAVFDDEYWLNVNGLPRHYFVAEAHAGNRDALREPVYGSREPLAIVISAEGPALAGTVVDQDGRGISSAVVVLALDPAQQAPAFNEILTSTAGTDGSFQLSGMKPGRYTLLAFDRLPDGLSGDPFFIASRKTDGTDLALLPKEDKTVTVKVTTFGHP